MISYPVWNDLGKTLREEILKVRAEGDGVMLMVLSGSCPCSHAIICEPRCDKDVFRGLRLNGSVPLFEGEGPLDLDLPLDILRLVYKGIVCHGLGLLHP